MNNDLVDRQDEAALEAAARRHGFGIEATRAMFEAVVRGNGSMAQFNHPEFGGAGQWMRGGMTMVGDMFNHRLKSAVDALCADLASVAGSRSEPRRSESSETRPPAATREDGANRPGADFGSSSGRWWPGDLGAANASGSQNGSRYAYFAASRRLAVETGGQITVYDTGEHRIGGVSQQSAGGSLTFTSQWGPVDLGRLAVVHPTFDSRGTAPSRAQASADSSARTAMRTDAQEVPALIEKLAELHAKGVLTDEEFKLKKADLLGRL